MSSPTRKPSDAARVRVPDLAGWRADGRQIVMVTAYDHPSAVAVEAAGVDVVLVGDSAANVVLGYDSTVQVTVDELLVLTAAVRRGLDRSLLVGDLPFGSYEVSDADAVRTAIRFVKEAGVDAVKLERGGTSAHRAAAIVAAGIPVMGHVGLTPQTAVALGGFRAQGRTAARAGQIVAEAQALAEAGCFALVAEAVPAPVTAAIRERVALPVIGIGSGPADGQVLVLHDLAGMSTGPTPRFVKSFGSLGDALVAAVTAYADDVRTGMFPGTEHTYPMSDEEAAAFKALLP